MSTVIIPQRGVKMNSKRKIAWEKWDDDIINEEIAEKLHVDEEDEELAADALELMSKIPKLVSTPLGIFQLYDKMSPIRQFECWMGYTNFDITHQIEEQIEKIEGVELLFTISRYRFFLGVAKMFSFRNVRTSVESLLNCNTKEPEDGLITTAEGEGYTEETVALIKEIISTDKYWAIFVSPDGQIEYASTNQDHDISFLEKLRLYKKLRRKRGGIILHPDSEE